jgi:predicted DCC family thiol-disulfide oxidoreductase YuxK
VAYSLNPLRCTGTALPPNLLLMAKLVALALLLTGHVRLLPEPFLPFIPGVDAIPGPLFRGALQTLFVVSALALLFNRSVRLSAVVLGAVMLLAVLSSKAYYGNNKTFCGLLLVLTGLSDARIGPRLIQWQVALVYFGAGLNKLMDPDWQSGRFFDHWAGSRLESPVYLGLAAALPPLVAAKFFCWSTIFVELGASGGLLAERTRAAAIWASILFQSALLLFTGTTFTMFFYGLQAAMLAFVAWPKAMTVIYDGDCGFCTKTKRFMERLDPDKLYDWRPAQSGVGERFGITREQLRERLYLAAGGRIASGFRAFQLMLLYNPLTYFVMVVAIAAAPAGWATYRRVVTGLLLPVFFPLFRPVGEALYDLVARNRGKLASSSVCDVR